MDGIGRFLGERCERVSGAEVTKADLYEAYMQWYHRQVEPGRPLSKLKFGKELANRGIEDGRTGDARCWRGVRLRMYDVNLTEFED